MQTNKKDTHTDKKFIAKSIKKLEYNIAYTTNNTLKRHLTSKTIHNTKHEKHASTGVYKLNCNDCPKYYIGQTGRYFKTRYTEHIVKALTQPFIKSNFAEHIFNTHHTYTNIEKNQEILHILLKGPKLNTTKQYEIL